MLQWAITTGREYFVQGLMRSEGPMLIRQEHCRSILNVLYALTEGMKKNMAVKLFKHFFELIRSAWQTVFGKNVTQLISLKILLDLTISWVLLVSNSNTNSFANLIRPHEKFLDLFKKNRSITVFVGFLMSLLLWHRFPVFFSHLCERALKLTLHI